MSEDFSHGDDFQGDHNHDPLGQDHWYGEHETNPYNGFEQDPYHNDLFHEHNPFDPYHHNNPFDTAHPFDVHDNTFGHDHLLDAHDHTHGDHIVDPLHPHGTEPHIEPHAHGNEGEGLWGAAKKAWHDFKEHNSDPLHQLEKELERRHKEKLANEKAEAEARRAEEKLAQFRQDMEEEASFRERLKRPLEEWGQDQTIDFGHGDRPSTATQEPAATASSAPVEKPVLNSQPKPQANSSGSAFDQAWKDAELGGAGRSKIPTLGESLEGVKLYELPVHTRTPSGVELIENPIVAFKHADNWYVAPKAGGKIPTDPSAWSLVAGNFKHNPSATHYHHTQGSPLSEELLEQIHNISSGLDTKLRAGSLVEIPSALTAKGIGNILLSKEKNGGGLQYAADGQLRIGLNEPLVGYIKEKGIKGFHPTVDETLSASYAEEASGKSLIASRHRANLEKLALHETSGNAFQLNSGMMGFDNPRERAFFAAHAEDPSKLRRIRIHMEEVLDAEGKRAHRPLVTEELISKEALLKEIGTDAIVSHAPESINQFMRTADPKHLQHFARKELAREFTHYQGINDAIQAGVDMKSTLHVGLGEQVAGKDITTQAWYRIDKGSDYVAHDAERIFDSNRADYFMVRHHPDYAKALDNAAPYSGPKNQLVFLKGDPHGGVPKSVEVLDIAGSEMLGSSEIAIQLQKKGIKQGGGFVKVGVDEIAEVWRNRDVSQHLTEKEFFVGSGVGNAQFKMLDHNVFETHPLKNPIAIDAAGKLTGDIQGLRVNEVYQLGDNTLVHISSSGFTKADTSTKLQMHVYDNSTGQLQLIKQEECLLDGHFEYALTKLIKEKGALSNATEQQMISMAEHLSVLSRGEGSVAVKAEHMLGRFVSADGKYSLPVGVDQRLEQAASGDLKGIYHELHIKPLQKAAAGIGHIPSTGGGSSGGGYYGGGYGGGYSSSAGAAERSSAKLEKTTLDVLKKESKSLNGENLIIFAAATAALGATAYMAYKALAPKKKEDPQAQTWAERLTEEPSAKGQATSASK